MTPNRLANRDSFSAAGIRLAARSGWRTRRRPGGGDLLPGRFRAPGFHRIQNNFVEGGGRTLRSGDKSYSARPEDLVRTRRAEESFARLRDTFVLELIDFFAKSGYLTGAEIGVAVDAYRAAGSNQR